MTKFFALFLTTFLLVSCGESPQLSEYTKEVKTSRITQIFRQNPCGIHDEISPKFFAVTLENDTINCTRYNKIGDSIYFIKYSK